MPGDAAGLDWALPAGRGVLVALTISLSLLLIIYEIPLRGTGIDGRRSDVKDRASRVEFVNPFIGFKKLETKTTSLALELAPELCETLEPRAALADARSLRVVRVLGARVRTWLTR